MYMFFIIMYYFLFFFMRTTTIGTSFGFFSRNNYVRGYFYGKSRVMFRLELQENMLASIVMVLMYATAFLKMGQGLIYECYPNATLRVENPGSFTSVFANNSVTICTTTWETGKTHVLVNGCGKEDNILLSFGFLPPSYAGVISGTENSTFMVNCIEIPNSGEFKTVNVSLAARLDEHDVSNFYHVGISSNIYEHMTNKTLATQAETGTALFWVLESEFEEFDLRPDECWAYAGKAVLDTVPKKYLIKNGCTLDSDLVSDFQWYQNSTGSTTWAVLYSFQFYGSAYITLQCKVRVCSRPSDACKIDCSDKRRRRRRSRNVHGKVNRTRDMMPIGRTTVSFEIIKTVLEP